MASFVDFKRTATVEVRIAANPLWFSIVRKVAEQLADRANFGEDARTDLLLAADEACGVLTELDPVEHELTCAFALRPVGIDLEISAPVLRRSQTVPTDAMNWQLLRSVSDELVVQHWPATGNAPGEFHLRLTKLR